MAKTPLVRKLADTDGPGESFSLGKVATIKDVKAQGTEGGGSVAGTQIRDLNTLNDPDNIGITLSSNQFTLPAGKYLINFSAPAQRVNDHKAWLEDTGGTDWITGSSEISGGSDNTQTISVGNGVITLNSSTTFEIKQDTASSQATNGLGKAVNLAGSDEIYTQVTIIKLG